MKRLKGMLSKHLAVVLAVAGVMSVSALPVNAEPKVMPDGTLFDAEYYAAVNPDVVKTYGTTDPDVMYKHYQEYGKKNGSDPVAPTIGPRLSECKSDSYAVGISRGYGAARMPDIHRHHVRSGVWRECTHAQIFHAGKNEKLVSCRKLNAGAQGPAYIKNTLF